MRKLSLQMRFCFAAVLVVLGGSCATTRQGETKRFEFQQPQMGVPFRIVLYAENGPQATNAADAAFARIKQLNQIMSDYEAESELMRLCRTSGSGRRVRVSDDLWKVLKASQKFAQVSRGAFDVTVGPYVALWRRARRQRELPETHRLESAAKAVGFGKMILRESDRSVELTVEGMKLDLGGIAKGYAADEALGTIRSHGICSAMVAAAGDIAVSEAPPGRAGWIIEIAPLDDEKPENARSVLLKRGAISTSGDTFQRLEIGGKRYSHIVDPRTGYGLMDHSLVTVLASSGMTADALSKVGSVLGPEKGLKVLRQFPGVEARIVREPAGKIERYYTPGFERRLVPRTN